MMEFRGDLVLKGPSLGDLVEKETTANFLKRNETAVAICCMKGRLGMLLRQLEVLEGQTFRKFDIIMVSPDDIEIPKTKFQAVALKLKGDYGAAASFYAAERYAVEKGYRYVIEADDDCYPADDGLVASLVDAARKHGLALTHTRFEGFSKPVKSAIIRYYGCISTELFRKCGYTYIPFMMFGDDLEITDRLRKLAKPAYVEGTVTHPTPAYLSLPLDRYSYYVRNGIITELIREEPILKKAANLAIRTFSILSYAVVLRMHGYGRKSSKTARAVMDALALRFGSEEGGGESEFCKNQGKLRIDAFFAQNEYVDPQLPDVEIKKRVRVGGQFSLASIVDALRFASCLAGCYGKNTLAAGRISTAIGPFLILASGKACILSKNEVYCFSAKGGSRLLRIALFALALPFISAASVLLSLLMLLRRGAIGRRLWKYGAG